MLDGSTHGARHELKVGEEDKNVTLKDHGQSHLLEIVRKLEKRYSSHTTTIEKTENFPKSSARSHHFKRSTPSSGEIRRWLRSHNKFRAQYSASPLVWDQNLADKANSETNTCVWRHSYNDIYGENIAAGQESIEEVVDEWVTGSEERRVYSPNNPTYSHFTQVVWGDTRRLGCAMTSCRNIRGSGLPQSPVKFWACEYYPLVFMHFFFSLQNKYKEKELKERNG
ncbi:CAP domain-containing protein [Phakopsora pachyrhizi]|nr:CAP domain-containing protein [Phakopsora pachyrhizi]